MVSPINGLQGVPPLASSALAKLNPPSAAPAAASFDNMLLESISQTNALEQSAQTAIEQSLTGGDITQVEVFTAVKKADLAMRMLLQMRNKALEAYQEIQQLRM